MYTSFDVTFDTCLKELNSPVYKIIEFLQRIGLNFVNVELISFYFMRDLFQRANS